MTTNRHPKHHLVTNDFAAFLRAKIAAKLAKYTEIYQGQLALLDAIKEETKDLPRVTTELKNKMAMLEYVTTHKFWYPYHSVKTQPRPNFYKTVEPTSKSFYKVGYREKTAYGYVEELKTFPNHYLDIDLDPSENYTDLVRTLEKKKSAYESAVQSYINEQHAYVQAFAANPPGEIPGSEYWNIPAALNDAHIKLFQADQNVRNTNVKDLIETHFKAMLRVYHGYAESHQEIVDLEKQRAEMSAEIDDIQNLLDEIDEHEYNELLTVSKSMEAAKTVYERDGYADPSREEFAEMERKVQADLREIYQINYYKKPRLKVLRKRKNELDALIEHKRGVLTETKANTEKMISDAVLFTHDADRYVVLMAEYRKFLKQETETRNTERNIPKIIDYIVQRQNSIQDHPLRMLNLDRGWKAKQQEKQDLLDSTPSHETELRAERQADLDAYIALVAEQRATEEGMLDQWKKELKVARRNKKQMEDRAKKLRAALNPQGLLVHQLAYVDALQESDTDGLRAEAKKVHLVSAQKDLHHHLAGMHDSDYEEYTEHMRTLLEFDVVEAETNLENSIERRNGWTKALNARNEARDENRLSFEHTRMLNTIHSKYNDIVSDAEVRGNKLDVMRSFTNAEDVSFI